MATANCSNNRTSSHCISPQFTNILRPRDEIQFAESGDSGAVALETVMASPGSSGTCVAKPAEAAAQPKLTRDAARRLIVSTDTEFFSHSRFVHSGKWSSCWCAHYKRARRASGDVLPELRIYYQLFKLSAVTNAETSALVPITDADYASIDALIPARTRAVWLSVVGIAAANAAYRGVPVIGYRVTYRQVIEALTQHDLSRQTVSSAWKEFIDMQIKMLSRIYYRRVAETGEESRTVKIEQPAPLPILGFMRRSDDPGAIYLQASAELFWVLNGFGRSRILPPSIEFPRSPWAFCVCVEMLSRVCQTVVSGRSDIRDLFSMKACKTIREQYAASIASGNLARDMRRLTSAVKKLLDSLVGLGALKSYTENAGVFAWQRGDRGQSLSEAGLFAHYLTLAADQVAAGKVGFCENLAKMTRKRRHNSQK